MEGEDLAHIAEGVPDDLFDSDLGQLLRALNIDANNIAGLVSLLSRLFGVQLDREPKPYQLTRLFNQANIRFDEAGVVLDLAEPVGKDGFAIANSGADALFKVEAAGLLDTLYPLAKAVSDHDREDVLVRLISVFHNHYSSRPELYMQKNGAPSPSKGSNFRVHEPAVKAILEETRLFDALYLLAQATNRFKANQGVDLAELLRVLVAHLTRADDSFTLRDGGAFINLPDGRTVQQLSRMHVLARGLDDIATKLEA
ncbi:MAG: hypothetical protein AAF909_14750, partial [Pseudomonadota bacterium]